MVFSFKRDKEHLTITLFIVFYVLYNLFGAPDFALTDYTKLYVSQATRDGVDISRRVGFFYRAIIASFILFPLVYFGLRSLINRLKLEPHKLQTPAILGFTGIILIISDVIGTGNERGIELLFFMMILSLILVVLSQRISSLRYLSKGSLFGTIMTASLLVITALIFIFNSTSQFPKNINAWYITTVIALLGVIVFLKNRGHRLRALLNWLLPLCTIPLILFICTEGIFLSNGNFHYKNWFVILFIITTALILFFQYRRKRLYSLRKLIVRFLAPSALLAFVLLSFYSPIIDQPKELFEFANPAIAQMRVFEFGEIPLVDFMSSHMLSEQFYGFIYHSIFGYDGSVSFYVYNFLYVLIFFILAYIFLIRVIKSPFLALLTLTTFPFVFLLFSTHLFYGMLVFFIVYGIHKRQTSARYFGLFFLLTLLIAWRLDTGASTLLASLLFVPISFFTERTKLSISKILKGSGAFAVFVLLMIIVFVLLRSTDDLWTNFKVALHYITANQAHGYSQLAYNYPHQFYIQHIILPASAVVFIFSLIFQLRKRKKVKPDRKHYALFASLFLFLVFIMNFQRALVRHGYLENNDYLLASTYFLALTLFVFGSIKRQSTYMNYLAFSGTALLLIFSLKYFPLSEGPSSMQTFLKQPPIGNLNEQLQNPGLEGRIHADKAFQEETYDGIKQFLDEHLSDTQTFLNFSSTPMLYYYCQRAVPAYFCQNHQNTVDDFLQFDHLNRIEPENVPVVLMPRRFLSPINMNSSDGILNDMRQYLMAEYIYANYQPYREINGQMVWVNEHIRVNEIESNEPNYYRVPGAPHHYGQLAKAMDLHFFSDQKNSLKSIKSSLPQFEDSVSTIIQLEPSVRKSHIFMRVHIKQPKPDYQIAFHVLDDKSQTISFTTFTTDEDQKSYTLLLSNHYLWYNRTPKRIRFNTDGVTIEKVEFFKDERTYADYR